MITVFFYLPAWLHEKRSGIEEIRLGSRFVARVWNDLLVKVTDFYGLTENLLAVMITGTFEGRKGTKIYINYFKLTRE